MRAMFLLPLAVLMSLIIVVGSLFLIMAFFVWLVGDGALAICLGCLTWILLAFGIIGYIIDKNNR
jgi:hypothetical protein